MGYEASVITTYRLALESLGLPLRLLDWAYLTNGEAANPEVHQWM